MNTNTLSSMILRHARVVRLSLIVMIASSVGTCGPIELGQVSPLSGTWSGINDPGGGYFGTVDFDFLGHLDSLEIVTLKGNKLYYTFDGQPRFDGDGNQYVATASTTLDDSEFEVKARVQYANGKHKGITRITIEGTVEHGSMTGAVRIAYPDTDPFVQDFKATRT
jgi:hypothetical protein